MKKMWRALEVDLPEEIDFWTCDMFMKSKKELSDAINEIIKRQKKSQFFAPNKFDISYEKWERIYHEISQSKYSRAANINPMLSPKYISKNHMVYGSTDIVLLMALQVYGCVLWLTPGQVEDFSLELETKIHWINPFLLHENFLQAWWKVLRQGLFTDLEFDTPRRKLKSNGGCKIRTRERDTVGNWLTEELTWKRKLSAAKNPQKELKKLNRLLDDMETSLDISSFSSDMKVLFEEPHIIHDHWALKEIFKILRLFVVSAKTKLRTSGLLDDTKLENEFVFWLECFLQSKENPFPGYYAELEASTPEKSLATRKLLWIDWFSISTDGTKQTLEYLWHEWQHMEFMKQGLKGSNRLRQDNEMFQNLLTRKALWRKLIQEGHFDAFPAEKK